VVVVADGGGGLRGGADASRCLVTVVGAAVDDPGFAVERMQAWVELFETTDSSLEANGAGETTGVVVVLGPGGLVGVSAGDSEAWVVTRTAADNLTVGRQTKQRLGTNRVIPSTFERPALRGVLVVASGGLFKFAASAVIAHVVRSHAFGAAADQLVDLVRLRSGQVADDVAVVLVRENAGVGIS